MPSTDDSLPPTGPTLLRAFEALVAVLNQRRIRYAIIGGLAVIQHARVRTTNDVDALLTLAQIEMPAFFEALEARGFDVDVVRNVREFRDHGLTTLRFEDVLVDLMRPVLPAYSHVIDRAVDRQIMGQHVRVSSAEGLIVMKVIAGRPQDQADIQELLAAYGQKLDLGFIRSELGSVLERNDPRLSQLESWIQAAGSG